MFHDKLHTYITLSFTFLLGHRRNKDAPFPVKMIHLSSLLPRSFSRKNLVLWNCFYDKTFMAHQVWIDETVHNFTIVSNGMEFNYDVPHVPDSCYKYIVSVGGGCHFQVAVYKDSDNADVLLLILIALHGWGHVFITKFWQDKVYYRVIKCVLFCRNCNVLVRFTN